MKMKINLKYKAMSILMSSLNETQMWAVYQMGMDNEIPSRIRSFLLVKTENSTCELDPSVTGFSLLVLCVCCEREKKGAAACFALQVRYFACKSSHRTFA